MFTNPFPAELRNAYFVDIHLGLQERCLLLSTMAGCLHPTKIAMAILLTFFLLVPVNSPDQDDHFCKTQWVIIRYVPGQLLQGNRTILGGEYMFELTFRNHRL